MILENAFYSIEVDEASGAITSLIVRETGKDLIGEKRLAANFRLCLPAEGYLANYADGMRKAPASVAKEGDTIRVHFARVLSDLGEVDIDVEYSVSLKDDYVSFQSRLTNNSSLQVSEFWFPRLGGLTEMYGNKDAKLHYPGYTSILENKLFRNLPAGRGLGAEAAEWSADYPGMVMPWWDFHDESTNRGMYMGYHDPIYRYSTWHTYLYPNVAGTDLRWMTPEQACGEPLGLIFSHVRYPFIHQSETFESGEFILRAHHGDWHAGSLFYRDWFKKLFPFDKSDSWLRRESSWFTSIIYQPEDRIITDYKGYDAWCRDAEAYGIGCHELIGWDKGGLERDYPEYVPEPKLGGREGFRELLQSIDRRGKKCLVFVNYNILDSCSAWYRDELHQYTHQDIFGNTPNWMAWGESTLLARKGVNVRRHLLASVVKPLTDILEEHFLELVRDGAHGLQIDKVCVGSMLDFNPLNEDKPDVALFEGLIRAIARLDAKCREINPDFRMASEAVQDRLIPYFDVYYRNSAGSDISPLRYVFPEWTSCQHVGMPYDWNGVNGAVLTGSVICVEPDTYQGSLNQPIWRKMGEYIREVERIRGELKEIIFTGSYYDTMGASVTLLDAKEKQTEKAALHIGGEVMIPSGTGAAVKPAGGDLRYIVHGEWDDGRRAIVIINTGQEPLRYQWTFKHRVVSAVQLYLPFEPVRIIAAGEPLDIMPEGLHILVEIS